MLARPAPPVPPAKAASALKDGVVALPEGKIAAVATYLEIRAKPRPAPALPLAGSVEPLDGDLARYRALYRRIGEPWLWFSRLLLSDEQLRAILDDPAVQPAALVRDGRDIGLAELDFRQSGQCEISFFGLVPDACGQGWGAALMQDSIRRAFHRPIGRVWLHTCTLDHPAALPFYVRCGFNPYRRAIEIADDPRLTGHLPRAAAPHFPIV